MLNMIIWHVNQLFDKRLNVADPYHANTLRNVGVSSDGLYGHCFK